MTPAAPPADAMPLGRLLPMLVVQALLGAVIAGAFVGLYIGVSRDPSPSGLPFAVVGERLARGAAEGLGDRADVKTAADAPAARRLLERHEAVGALVPAEGGSGLTLLTAGANGRSATQAVTEFGRQVAKQGGTPIRSTVDVVPPVAFDKQGISGFYLVFGSTLASFILAQIMFALPAAVAMRWRLATLLSGSLLAAVLATVLSGPVYGSVPAPFLEAFVVLALLGAGVGLTTLAIANVLGPLGNVLSTLLFTIVGNAAGGATINPHLLPGALSAIGAVLPPGAAFRAVVAFGYFDGRGAVGPLLTLLAWVAAAGAVLAWKVRPAQQRSGSTVAPASGATAAA